MKKKPENEKSMQLKQKKFLMITLKKKYFKMKIPVPVEKMQWWWWSWWSRLKKKKTTSSSSSTSSSTVLTFYTLQLFTIIVTKKIFNQPNKYFFKENITMAEFFFFQINIHIQKIIAQLKIFFWMGGPCTIFILINDVRLFKKVGSVLVLWPRSGIFTRHDIDTTMNKKHFSGSIFVNMLACFCFKDKLHFLLQKKNNMKRVVLQIIT